FSSRRRHTRFSRDWSSDVCSSDLRPSLLLGDRKEDRPGEDAAKFFYRVFGFLIPKKYKGIDSLKVARAMHHFARQEQEGKHIHRSEERRVGKGGRAGWAE